jgi:hypothetical protein
MAEGNGGGPPIRLRRLALHLRVRRRRLRAFDSAPDWPGKGPARQSEQLAYDQMLLVAARMLEVPAPESIPLPPVTRAVIEDALAIAGLDVLSATGASGDPFEDDDLML